MDDKLIEVVGMYSSLHIGTIQVSLAEPLRIGQASEVKVNNSTLSILHIINTYIVRLY